MNQTLFSKMKKAEEINEDLYSTITSFLHSLQKYKEVPGFSGITFENVPAIDTQEYQRSIMSKYESNPVLVDAIEGRKSIEDSLTELAQVHTPVSRLFPIRKDSKHNKRLSELGELVYYPAHLRTNGIFFPDNFVSGVATVAALAYGTANVVAPFLYQDMNSNSDTILATQTMEFMKETWPGFFTLIVGPVMGISAQLGRTGRLPVEEAKYLDEKVNEFYR